MSEEPNVVSGTIEMPPPGDRISFAATKLDKNFNEIPGARGPVCDTIEEAISEYENRKC